MNEQRIKEAKENMKDYLLEGFIKKQVFDKNIFDIYMRNYKESLIVSQKIFEDKTSDLWVIVTSYYSMFYIANAYLLTIGYKVGHKIAHRVTADALIVYVKNKLKENYLEEYEIASDEALLISESLIETYDLERLKRSKIQYETPDSIKHSKAQTSLERAKKFGLEIEKLMLK